MLAGEGFDPPTSCCVRTGALPLSYLALIARGGFDPPTSVM